MREADSQRCDTVNKASALSPWLSHRDAVNVLWGDGHAAAADRGEFTRNYNKWGVMFLPR